MEGYKLISISKEKVRMHMKKQGLSTQKELAENLGISKNQLSMMLSPSFNPIKSNALKLCKALDVNIEEIIEYKQTEKSYVTLKSLKSLEYNYSWQDK